MTKSDKKWQTITRMFIIQLEKSNWFFYAPEGRSKKYEKWNHSNAIDRGSNNSH